MPQVDIDGANSKVSADVIRGQSGTTVTVLAGHNLVGSGSGLTALPAANLTGTLPAISGASLTNLPDRYVRTDTPCWGGKPATDQFNCTGGGTTATLVWGTEFFDQGNNFDATSTYTAPVTGKYLICVNVEAYSYAGTEDFCEVQIVTSNRTYRRSWGNTNLIATSAFGHSMAQVCDLDACDTATLTYRVTGGSDVLDVDNSRACASVVLVA